METETRESKVAAGSDCGPVEDVTIAVEGRWDGRGEGESKGRKGDTCELNKTVQHTQCR